MVKNKLKEILKSKGTKQTWLCEQTEITASTMSNIINNRYSTSMEVGFKIAKVLNMTITDIFYYEED